MHFSSLSSISSISQLMEVLDNPEYSCIISWLDNGNDFIFHDVEAFCRIILPKYFRKTSLFSSFKRKLNRWGFRTRDRGKETRIYHHPLFSRGGHYKLHQMKQRTSSMDKTAAKTSNSGTGHDQSNTQATGKATTGDSSSAAYAVPDLNDSAKAVASLLFRNRTPNAAYPAPPSLSGQLTSLPIQHSSAPATTATNASSLSDVARFIQQDPALSSYFWGVFWEEYRKQLPMQQAQHQQQRQDQANQSYLQTPINAETTTHLLASLLANPTHHAPAAGLSLTTNASLPALHLFPSTTSLSIDPMALLGGQERDKHKRPLDACKAPREETNQNDTREDISTTRRNRQRGEQDHTSCGHPLQKKPREDHHEKSANETVAISRAPSSATSSLASAPNNSQCVSSASSETSSFAAASFALQQLLQQEAQDKEAHDSTKNHEGDKKF